MAAVDTLSSTPVPANPAQQPLANGTQANGTKKFPILESLPASERVPFDPKKHLNFSPPSKVWTMKELGYPDSRGVSPIGVSEPFPLFTPEAIKQMRAEVLSEEVFTHYQYSSNLAQCQLRGFAREYATLSFSKLG